MQPIPKRSLELHAGTGESVADSDEKSFYHECDSRKADSCSAGGSNSNVDLGQAPNRANDIASIIYVTREQYTSQWNPCKESRNSHPYATVFLPGFPPIRPNGLAQHRKAPASL